MKLSFALSSFLTVVSTPFALAATAASNDGISSHLRHGSNRSPNQAVMNQQEVLAVLGADEHHRSLEQQPSDCLNVKYNVNCNANDVNLGQITIKSGPSYCTEGEWVTFTADYTLVRNRNEGYDVGLFVSIGDTPDALNGDSCVLLGLPFVQVGDAGYDPNNICGDIDDPDSKEEIIKDVELTVLCYPSSNAKLAIPYCTAWNQGNTDTCTSLDDIKPGTKSKCKCGEVEAEIQACNLQFNNPKVYESCKPGELAFETTVANGSDNPIDVTWTFTNVDSGDTFEGTGLSGVVSGLDAGTYTVSVTALDGPCGADAVVAANFEVYEPLSVSASLTGGCEDKFTYSSSVTGGRLSGENSYTWVYLGDLSGTFSGDSGTISPAPSTGNIEVKLLYAEYCGAKCKNPDEQCTPSTQPTADTVVYKPIDLTADVYESCTSGEIIATGSIADGTGVGGETLTWTIKGRGESDAGSRVTFSGLPEGSYEILVSTGGMCGFLERSVEADVSVYDLEVSASLTGGCESKFIYDSTVTGGRGGGSYSWSYVSGSGASIPSDAGGEVFPGTTGDFVVELTYSESCGGNCEDPTDLCSASSGDTNSVSVYDPITISGVAIAEPQDTCGGRRERNLVVDDGQRHLQEGPIYNVDVSAQGGGPNGLTYTPSPTTGFTCGTDGKCTLDLSGVTQECQIGSYYVTVADPDGVCTSVDTVAIRAEKTTTYTVATV